MPISLDLCSTEDHGHHLQNEAVHEDACTLRPRDAQVKSARTARPWRAGGHQNHERRFHFLSLQATICLSGLAHYRTGPVHRSGLTAPRVGHILPDVMVLWPHALARPSLS